MNLATKAPNFTRENAREMALRSIASRKARLAREKAEREAAEKAALNTAPAPDEARNARVRKQVDLLLNDLERAETLKERLALIAAITRLWKLVQPTAGQLKPGRKAQTTPFSLPVLPEGEYQGTQGDIQSA